MLIESLERRTHLSVVAPTATVGRPPVLKGLAALGDSITDEYRTHSPLRTPHRSWVEVLADNRKLNFGSYSEAERPQPRAAGYQYNWARDGATSGDLITDMQHVGVANAAKAGNVSLVFVHAGHNDFSQLLRSDDPRAALADLPEKVTANLQTTVDTLLASNPNVKVVVATLFDVRYVPSVRLGINTGVIPKEAMPFVAAAQKEVNANIRAMAADPRVAVADVAAAYDKFLTRPTFRLAGQDIGKFRAGSTATDFWAADAVHPGTVGQAVIANTMVAAANAKFGAMVRPLSGDEIMAYAKKVSAAGTSGSPFSDISIDADDQQTIGRLEDLLARARSSGAFSNVSDLVSRYL